MKRIIAVSLLAVLLILALPAIAQDVPTYTVSINGVTLSYPSSHAQNVNIWRYAGDPLDAQQPSLDSAFWQFTLYNDGDLADQSLFEYGKAGGIRVYNVDDAAPYEFMSEQIEALKTLVATKPDLAPFEVFNEFSETNLPFLPVVPAMQVIRAKAEYVSTDSFDGISYISAYRQDVSPFLSQDFIYTLQAISKDGKTVIVAIFPLNIDVFPNEFPADFNYDDFMAKFNDYMAESIAQINSAEATSFSPSLDTLKGIMTSISINQ